MTSKSKLRRRGAGRARGRRTAAGTESFEMGKRLLGNSHGGDEVDL